MASIDRYRPREGYRPPPLPQQPKQPAAPAPAVGVSATGAVASAPTTAFTTFSGAPGQLTNASSTTRRRDVPPAVPSPPSYSSRTSPPVPGSHNDAPSGLVSPNLSYLAAQHPAPVPTQTQAPVPVPVPAPAPAPPKKELADLPPFASQWFYTDDELKSTPSVLDGLSLAEERERRAKGVNFIYQAGIAVQPVSLPQVTMYVAAVFFHRFFMRMSMVEERGGIHHYKIAATALFLANKTEENCFKTKHLIIAVAKVAMKNYNQIIDEQSKEYWRWRDCILTYEELMLETLTFDLMIANPYDQLPLQLRRLGQIGCKPLRESAWTFLNDCALTTLPLRLDAVDIASASIFFASIATGETLDDIQGQPWWKAIRADEGRITLAINTMVAFYRENPLKKQNSRIHGSPVFHLETTRRSQPPHDLAHHQGDGARDGSGSVGGGGGGGGAGGGSGSQSSTARAPSGGRPQDPSHDVTPMRLDSSNSSIGQPSQTQTATTWAGTSQTTTTSTAPTSVPGDSDAGLKAAANDLDRHTGSRIAAAAAAAATTGSNGSSLLPPSHASPSKKRKTSIADDDNDNDNDNYNDAPSMPRGGGDADTATAASEEGEVESQPPPSKRARPSVSPLPRSRTSGGENESSSAV